MLIFSFSIVNTYYFFTKDLRSLVSDTYSYYITLATMVKLTFFTSIQLGIINSSNRFHKICAGGF